MLGIEELYVQRFHQQVGESYKETQMQPQYELQAAKGLHKMLLKIEKDYDSKIKCLRFFATASSPTDKTNVYFYPKSNVSYDTKVPFKEFFSGIISYPHPWEMLAVYDNMCKWLARVNDKEANDIYLTLKKRVVTILNKGSNYNNYTGSTSGKDLTIEWDKEALNPLLRALYIYIAALEGKTGPAPTTRNIQTSQIIRGIMLLLKERKNVTTYVFTDTDIKHQYRTCDKLDKDFDLYSTYFQQLNPEPWDIFEAMKEVDFEAMKEVEQIFPASTWKDKGVNIYYKECNTYLEIAQGKNISDSWSCLHRMLDKYLSQGVTATQTQADNNKEKLGSVSSSERPYAHQYEHSPIVATPHDNWVSEFNELKKKCHNKTQQLTLEGMRFAGEGLPSMKKYLESCHAMDAHRYAINPPMNVPCDIRPGAVNLVWREDKEFKIPSLKEMYNNIFRKKKEKQMEPIINNITAKVKNLSPDTVTKLAAIGLLLLVIGKYSLVKKLLIDVKKNIQDSDSYKEIVKDGTTVVANAKKLVGIDKAGE